MALHYNCVVTDTARQQLPFDAKIDLPPVYPRSVLEFDFDNVLVTGKDKPVDVFVVPSRTPQIGRVALLSERVAGRGRQQQNDRLVWLMSGILGGPGGAPRVGDVHRPELDGTFGQTASDRGWRQGKEHGQSCKVVRSLDCV